MSWIIPYWLATMNLRIPGNPFSAHNVTTNGAMKKPQAITLDELIARLEQIRKTHDAGSWEVLADAGDGECARLSVAVESHDGDGMYVLISPEWSE